MFRTKIPFRWQNTAFHRHEAMEPQDLKQMKYEVKRMREDLLRKQERLEKSPRYSADELLKVKIKEISLKNKTELQVRESWQYLKRLEESNYTSIRGKQRADQMRIDMLHMEGYDWINMENIQKWSEFITHVDDMYKNYQLDSEQVMQFFEENQKLSNEEIRKSFDEWVASGNSAGGRKAV